MEFENEHWKLVITPRYVRKDQPEELPCVHCGGEGFDKDDESMGFGDHRHICWYCHGAGVKKGYKPIPPPPEIDQTFIQDLKQWFQNYGSR